jgi:hypothetical protein
VDVTGPGSCSVAGFGIKCVEPLGCTIGELSKSSDSWL